MKNILAWGAKSTEGTVKSVNEDGYFASSVAADGKNYGIFAVCDGIGGLSRGELAAAIALSHIKDWWEKIFLSDRARLNACYSRLKEEIEGAAEEIEQKAGELGTKMGTTLSALLIYGDSYYTAHTGDSRIYMQSGSRRNLVRLTRDQCALVNIPYEGTAVQKSVLTDCLGASKSVNLLMSGSQIERKSTFLVCSDGVYKRIADNEIGAALSKGKPPQTICGHLIETAEKRGETDNITAIVVRTE